jgi:hypothetical protein
MFAPNLLLSSWDVDFSYPVGLVGRRGAALFAGIGVMFFWARNAEPSSKPLTFCVEKRQKPLLGKARNKNPAYEVVGGIFFGRPVGQIKPSKCASTHFVSGLGCAPVVLFFRFLLRAQLDCDIHRSDEQFSIVTGKFMTVLSSVCDCRSVGLGVP